MAHSVEHPTLDLSSGLHLRVLSSSSMLGSPLGMEPTFKKGEKRTKEYPNSWTPPKMQLLIFLEQNEKNRTKKSSNAKDVMASVQTRVFAMPKGLWNIHGS